MVIAYLRVSTERQLLENQKNEIGLFARARGLQIRSWPTEKVCGTASAKDRKLNGLLRQLKAGDVLIVSEISRLSRTMLEIMSILHLCIRKQIVLYSVKEGYAFENNMTSKIMGFAFGMAAEIERNLISARTREALAYRKAQGVVLGRPKGSCTRKKLLEEHDSEIRELLREGVRKTDIARRFGVSKATFYAFLKESLPERK